MFDASHRVLIIAGLTASGKSALALDLAQDCDGVVINADSMQTYKDIPIISAAPTEADKAKAPHKLYGIYDAAYNATVVDWVNKAAEEIKNCWENGKLPIVVGGTGMYIDYLIKGTTPIPEIDPNIREHVRKWCRENGLRNLHAQLKEFDPETAAKLPSSDLGRVTKACEVYLQTGIPISEWFKKGMIKVLPEAHFTVTELMPLKRELDDRCFERFDHMIQKGVLAEVVHLAERRLDENLPAMKAVGVPELMRFIKGEVSLDNAIMMAKLRTRQYAKRQRTWFTHKLRADVYIEKCYSGQLHIINDVKKRL